MSTIAEKSVLLSIKEATEFFDAAKQKQLTSMNGTGNDQGEAHVEVNFKNTDTKKPKYSWPPL